MTQIEPSGVRIIRADLSAQAQGFQKLATIEANVATTSLGPLQFESKDVLMIQGFCFPLSAADTIGFQFNQDISANYSTTPLFGDQGTALFVGSSAVSQNLMELHNDGLTTAGTQLRFFFITVSNRRGLPKLAAWRMAKSTGSAATVGGLYAGVGQYYNLDANISSATLRSATGTVTMGAGTAFSVYGKDL